MKHRLEKKGHSPMAPYPLRIKKLKNFTRCVICFSLISKDKISNIMHISKIF